MARIAPVHFTSGPIATLTTHTEQEWRPFHYETLMRVREIRRGYPGAANSHSTLMNMIFSGGIELHRNGGREKSTRDANTFLGRQWIPFAEAAFNSIMLYGFAIAMIHPTEDIPVVLDPCEFPVSVSTEMGLTTYRVQNPRSRTSDAYIKDAIVFESSAPRYEYVGATLTAFPETPYTSIMKSVDQYDVVMRVTSDAYVRGAEPTALSEMRSNDPNGAGHDHFSAGDHTRANRLAQDALVHQRTQAQLASSSSAYRREQMQNRAHDVNRAGQLPSAIARAGTSAYRAGGVNIVPIPPNTRVSHIVTPVMPPPVSQFENNRLKTFAHIYGIVPLWADSSGMREYLGTAIMQIIACTRLAHTRMIVSILEPMLQHALTMDAVEDVSSRKAVDGDSAESFVQLVDDVLAFTVVIPGTLSQDELIVLNENGLFEHEVFAQLVANICNIDPKLMSKKRINPLTGKPAELDMVAPAPKRPRHNSTAPKPSSKPASKS